MKSFLDLTLQDPASRPDIDFPSTTKCFGAISSTFLSPVMPSDAINLDMPLSRPQEEYLLRHFWGSYSWIYPIVDGDEFRAHYDSLWDDGDSSMLRKPSALVDIILAVCMQSEAAMVTPQGTETGFQPFDTVSAVIAGRNMYLRSKSQTFMTDELDGPSIRTFQCYLYSVIYLSNACFHNMAHSVMALAIRYATAPEVPKPFQGSHSQILYTCTNYHLEQASSSASTWNHPPPSPPKNATSANASGGPPTP